MVWATLAATGCHRPPESVLPPVLPAARVRIPASQRRLELGPDDVVVRRQSLDELRDDVYVLSCAVDDAERDLAELRRPSVSELQRIIADLIEASNALRRPSAVPH